MSEVVYKEFRIGDLFEIGSPKKRFNANAIQIHDKPVTGSHPYVVRTSQNNGQRGYIIQDEKYLSPANTFSFGQDTATVFFQTEPYFTGDKIKIMSLKDKSAALSEQSACYLMKLLRASFANYSWGQSSFNEETLCNNAIKLPVTLDNIPDYQYMEKYISELEQECISELEHYLIETGLNDCELTDEDKNILLKNKKIGEFIYSDLFELLKVTNKRSKLDIVANGDVPLLSSDTTNNGIIGYVSIAPEFIASDICPYYIVFGDHTRTMNLITESFCVADNVKVLKPLVFNKRATQYICTVWQKSIPNQGYARHWSVAKNAKFTLPITPTGEPDYEYMENYIRVQEKLVIKDVIAYIAAARKG